VIPAAEGAELIAVAARDVDRARELGAPKAYGDYQQLIDDPDVDAVYIGLPNDAHLGWSLAALEVGKAVLCEKPLALSSAQVDEMIEAVERTGGLLVEASWYRWHPRTQLAERLLRAGEIGKVTHVSAGFTFPGVAPDNFRLDPGKGGGALYDVGCYALSGVLWSVGAGLPTEVTARAERSETGVDLSADVILTWDGSTEADVHVAMSESPRQWLIIRGEHGEIEFPDVPFTAWWGAPAELLVSDGRETRRLEIPAADAYKLMFEQTSAAHRGQPSWVVPLAESRMTAAVLDAALASAADNAGPVRPR